jgi:hypothetical protein
VIAVIILSIPTGTPVALGFLQKRYLVAPPVLGEGMPA